MTLACFCMLDYYCYINYEKNEETADSGILWGNSTFKATC